MRSREIADARRHRATAADDIERRLGITERSSEPQDERFQKVGKPALD